MSAFIVEPKTINRIITALDSFEFYDIRTQLRELGCGDDFQTVGRAMMNLNVAAVNHRYREKTHPGLICYHFCPEPVNLVQAFKSLRCWLYQCAEGEIPEHPLYHVMEEYSHLLANKIVGTLPDYDDADWG